MDIEIIYYPKEYLNIAYIAAKTCYGKRKGCIDDDIGLKKKLIYELIKKRHLSIFEHIQASIFIKDASRSFLAQITRHRLCAFSVKSQHFLKHKKFRYKPLESDLLKIEYDKLMENIQNFYSKALKVGMPHYIAREVLPNSCYTDIFMSANIREWRHIIKERITHVNTPEIRYFSKELLLLLYGIMPEFVEDLVAEYVKLH